MYVGSDCTEYIYRNFCRNARQSTSVALRPFSICVSVRLSISTYLPTLHQPLCTRSSSIAFTVASTVHLLILLCLLLPKGWHGISNMRNDRSACWSESKLTVNKRRELTESKCRLINWLQWHSLHQMSQNYVSCCVSTCNWDGDSPSRTSISRGHDDWHHLLGAEIVLWLNPTMGSCGRRN